MKTPDNIFKYGFIKVMIPFCLIVLFALIPVCSDEFAVIMEEETIEAENIPPVPGNSGVITVSDIKATSLKLSWDKAADDTTYQSYLQYRVFRSLNDNIVTLAKADENGNEITAGWTVDIDNVIVLGLKGGSSFYFNVFVRDIEDNDEAYTAVKASTVGGLVYIFLLGNCNRFIIRKKPLNAACFLLPPAECFL